MTWYYRRLDHGLTVMHARPEHAGQLEALQLACFPTLADEERFKARHYRRHLEIFDEGQFVALDGDRVVGATATIRLDFDFARIDHTFADIIQGGWLTSHEPDGAWLYGADIGVDPGYRGRGLATALYAARQELVWRRGLKGQVTAGMLAGYGAVKHEISAQDYYAGVVAGRIKDATLSMQLALGFEPRALLEDYLNDPVSDNYSALIVLDAATDVPGASRDLARRYVRLHGPVPGPRATALLDRRAAALPSGLGRATDVVVERAHDALIVDVDGNTFIDLASGIGVAGVGHSPAAVVAAIATQAEKFLHTCALVTTYEPMVAPGRSAERADAGHVRQEDDLRQQRRRGGRERGQVRPQGHRPPGRHLLRGRLSRAHPAHADADQQVRSVQERLRSVRARDRAPAAAARLPHAGRHDRGAVPGLRHPPARTGVRGAGRSGGRRRRDHRAGAGRGRLHSRARRASCSASASCAPSTAS